MISGEWQKQALLELELFSGALALLFSEAAKLILPRTFNSCQKLVVLFSPLPILSHRGMLRDLHHLRFCASFDPRIAFEFCVRGWMLSALAQFVHQTEDSSPGDYVP